MSSIVCPACKAYLGLNAANLVVCPKCGALTPVAREGEVSHSDEMSPEAQRKRDIVIGGLWLFGGTVVTAVTYMVAAIKGEGYYVLAWGPMFFGGVQFLQGLLGNYAKPKPAAPKDFCKACRFSPVEPNVEDCPRCGKANPNPVAQEAKIGCVATCFGGLGAGVGMCIGLGADSLGLAFLLGIFGFMLGVGLVSLVRLTKPFFKWVFG